MKRRNFILIVIAGLMGTVSKWATRPDARYAPSQDYMLLVQGLSEIFRDTDAAVNVGEAYLRNHPDNNILAHLLSGIGLDPQKSAVLSPADFHHRRQNDFEQGRTVLFNGWVMARSELCACALLTYSRKEPGIL
jgi:hypothetical protein